MYSSLSSLDGIENVALWDTGAEVALIGRKWLNEKVPGKKIQDVSELLGQELYLKVANNSSLECEGYTELVFKMSDAAKPLVVPFLVTVEETSMPIIGYNVIEELVKGEMQKSNQKIVEMLGGSLREGNKKKVEGLITMIQKKVSYDETENLGDVKVGSKDIVIPRGTNMKMKCISHCVPVRVDNLKLN